MSEQEFANQLNEGTRFHYLYESSLLEGLVEAWKYGSIYCLTWEECPPGEQYDESKYTRDDVHHFKSILDLIAFISRSNLTLDQFST